MLKYLLSLIVSFSSLGLSAQLASIEPEGFEMIPFTLFEMETKTGISPKSLSSYYATLGGRFYKSDHIYDVSLKDDYYSGIFQMKNNLVCSLRHLYFHPELSHVFVGYGLSLKKEDHRFFNFMQQRLQMDSTACIHCHAVVGYDFFGKSWELQMNVPGKHLSSLPDYKQKPFLQLSAKIEF
ncbi:MAG TPA: hypothetical protein P5048_02005 [Chlamydiales bacterium]|nr:hypothetical protein [Chlamydiales bacterium]